MKKSRNKSERISYQISTDMIAIVISFVAFWYLGKLIDEHYGFQKVFQLVGILFGLITMFVKLFALVRSVNETKKK